MESPLNKAERSALKALLREPGWEAMLKLYKTLTDKNNATEASGTNAFETLRALHVKQGKNDGMTELMNEAERLVQ